MDKITATEKQQCREERAEERGRHPLTLEPVPPAAARSSEDTQTRVPLPEMGFIFNGNLTVRGWINLPYPEHSPDEAEEARRFVIEGEQWEAALVAHRRDQGRPRLIINKCSEILDIAIARSQVAGQPEDLTPENLERLCVLIYRKFADEQRAYNLMRSTVCEQRLLPEQTLQPAQPEPRH